MNIKKLLSKILLIGICVGAVPAYAAQAPEVSDYNEALSIVMSQPKFCRQCGFNLRGGAASVPKKFRFCPSCSAPIVKPAGLERQQEQQGAVAPVNEGNQAEDNQMASYLVDSSRLGGVVNFSLDIASNIHGQLVQYVPFVKKNVVPLAVGLGLTKLAWDFRSDIVQHIYRTTPGTAETANKVVDYFFTSVLGRLPKVIIFTCGLHGLAAVCEMYTHKPFLGVPVQQQAAQAAMVLRTTGTIAGVAGLGMAVAGASKDMALLHYPDESGRAQACLLAGLAKAGLNTFYSVGKYAGLAFTSRAALRVMQQGRQISAVPIIEEVD